MSVLEPEHRCGNGIDRNTAQEKDQDQSCLDRRAEQLHKIAIKWHTIRKDLSDIQEHIVHLRTIAKGKAFTSKEITGMLKSPDAVDALKALESTCKFWSRWVTAYLERTNIRINLVSAQSQNTATKWRKVKTNPRFSRCIISPPKTQAPWRQTWHSRPSETAYRCSHWPW